MQRKFSKDFGLKATKLHTKDPALYCVLQFSQTFLLQLLCQLLGTTSPAKVRRILKLVIQKCFEKHLFLQKSKNSPENVRGRVPLHESIFFYVRSGSITNIFLKKFFKCFQGNYFSEHLYERLAVSLCRIHEYHLILLHHFFKTHTIYFDS